MSIHQVFDQLNESRAILEASSGIDGYHVEQLVVSRIEDEVCRDLHSLRAYGRFSRRTSIGDSKIISYRVGADSHGWNGETRRGFISHHSQVVVRPYATDEMTMPLEVGVEMDCRDGNHGDFEVSVSAPLVKARRLVVKGKFRWDTIESDADKLIRAFESASEKWWSDTVRDAVHVYAMNHALNVEESGEVSESFKDGDGMFRNKKDFDHYFQQGIVEEIQKLCRTAFTDSRNNITCKVDAKTYVFKDTMSASRTNSGWREGVCFVAIPSDVYRGSDLVANIEVQVGLNQKRDYFQLAVLANGRVSPDGEMDKRIGMPQYTEKGRWNQYERVSRKFLGGARRRIEDYFEDEIVPEFGTIDWDDFFARR